MPSPFPGMDPYMEDPFTWQGVHNSLIVYLSEALNAVLPPDYVADIGVRCLTMRASNEILPDIFVQEERVPPGSERGGTALLKRSQEIDIPLLLRSEEIEERQAYLNVIHVRDERIVTAIEILSPTNKNTRDNGYQAYRNKQEAVLASQTHLIEIDWLRVGTHTVAVPEWLVPHDRKRNYLICLHRGGHGDEFEVWTHTIRDRLPRIAVPLEDGLPDVPLDLQPPYDHLYSATVILRKWTIVRKRFPH